MLDDVLNTFYSIRAQARLRSASMDMKSKLIESTAAGFDKAYSELPSWLKDVQTACDVPGARRSRILPVRLIPGSLQLTCLGMRLLFLRISMDCAVDAIKCFSDIVRESGELVIFLENLSRYDAQAFWMPCEYTISGIDGSPKDCSYLLSFANTLLVRIAVRAGQEEQTSTKTECCGLVIRLVSCLRKCLQELEWEVAESALPRCMVVIRSVVGMLPDLGRLLDEPVAIQGADQRALAAGEYLSEREVTHRQTMGITLWTTTSLPHFWVWMSGRHLWRTGYPVSARIVRAKECIISRYPPALSDDVAITATVNRLP